MKYMLGIQDWEPLPDDDELNIDELTFDIRLMLPSDIDESIRMEVCASGIIKEEVLIQEKMAYETLTNIRRLLMEESVKKSRKRK